MTTYLQYFSRQQLFDGPDFKPWVYKWFDNPVLIWEESCGSYPCICVTNWDQVRDSLPKSFLPVRIISGVESKRFDDLPV